MVPPQKFFTEHAKPPGKPKTSEPPLSLKEKKQIQNLSRAGHSYAQIAAQLKRKVLLQVYSLV
jgi:Helix-turn-helix domain